MKRAESKLCLAVIWKKLHRTCWLCSRCHTCFQIRCQLARQVCLTGWMRGAGRHWLRSTHSSHLGSECFNIMWSFFLQTVNLKTELHFLPFCNEEADYCFVFCSSSCSLCVPLVRITTTSVAQTNCKFFQRNLLLEHKNERHQQYLSMPCK